MVDAKTGFIENETSLGYASNEAPKGKVKSDLEDDLEVIEEAVQSVQIGDPVTKISSNGLFFYDAEADIYCGMGISTLGDTRRVVYSWDVSADNGQTWTKMLDWNYSNSFYYSPYRFGSYMIRGWAMIDSDASTLISTVAVREYHPEISATCQMPNPGPEGGFLVGMTTYENMGYYYELLILDCNLYLQGLPAWVYTTTPCAIEGTSFWTVWAPVYGYYWTLFRVYDGGGSIIDEVCYGFENDGTIGKEDLVTKTGLAMYEYAIPYIGTKYVLGGNSLKTGTDCSGFTRILYKQFGIATMPHSATQQSYLGREIQLQDLKPGDLVFYTYNSNRIEHVAMYIGNGAIIHSGRAEDGSSCINIRYNYYVPYKAVRIMKD